MSEDESHKFVRVYDAFSMLYRGPKTLKRMSPDPAWRALVRRWCNPARYKAFMKGESE